jgi:hypothetical protein
MPVLRQDRQATKSLWAALALVGSNFLGKVWVVEPFDCRMHFHA